MKNQTDYKKELVERFEKALEHVKLSDSSEPFEVTVLIHYKDASCGFSI